MPTWEAVHHHIGTRHAHLAARRAADEAEGENLRGLGEVTITAAFAVAILGYLAGFEAVPVVAVGVGIVGLVLFAAGHNKLR